MDFFSGLESPYSFGKGRVWAGEPWDYHKSFFYGACMAHRAFETYILKNEILKKNQKFKQKIP